MNLYTTSSHTLAIPVQNPRLFVRVFTIERNTLRELIANGFILGFRDGNQPEQG